MKPKKSKAKPSYDLEEVKKILFVYVNKVTMGIVQSLIDGRKDGVSFKDLYDKKNNPTLEKELSQSDPTLKRVFTRLFLQTNNHIKVNSPLILDAFVKIQQQTEINDSPGRFLASFVFPVAFEVIVQLNKEQPAVLEDFEFWKQK